jgi:hypothetical protein
MRVRGGFGMLNFFYQFLDQVVEPVVPVYVRRHFQRNLHLGHTAAVSKLFQT